MNKMQRQILDFAIAQIEVDSTPGLPLCCNEHKELGWVQINFFFFDLLADPRSGPILAEVQCLN